MLPFPLEAKFNIQFNTTLSHDGIWLLPLVLEVVKYPGDNKYRNYCEDEILHVTCSPVVLIRCRLMLHNHYRIAALRLYLYNIGSVQFYLIFLQPYPLLFGRHSIVFELVARYEEARLMEEYSRKILTLVEEIIHSSVFLGCYRQVETTMIENSQLFSLQVKVGNNLTVCSRGGRKLASEVILQRVELTVIWHGLDLLDHLPVRQ